MGTCRAPIVCFLLFVVLGVSSSAQQPQSPQFKLEGLVVNSVTGKPLSRVLVQMNGRSMLTGPEGEFSFDSVPAGTSFVGLIKPGYFIPASKPLAGTMGHSINVGPDTGKVVLKLAPEAVVTGQVTGQDGEPLEGAAIQVLAYMWMDGGHQLVPARGAVRTDEDGNFRIAGLRAGRYYLEVKAGNVTRRVLGAQSSKAPTAYPAVVYYPGTPELAASAALDLLAGQKMEAEFSLALATAYRLTGQLVTVGGWKQIFAPVIVDALDQPLFGADQFDPTSGAFEFRAVPAGTYSVRVSGTDLQDRHNVSIQKMTVSRNVSDLRFSLRPGLEIPVAVRTEFSKPKQSRSCSSTQPGGAVEQSDCSDYPPARIELMSTESLRIRFSTDYSPMKDPAGLSLHGVAPGKYRVRAMPTMGGYVQSVRSGNLDLLREELIVPEDGTVAPIEVVLRDDTGALNVVVRTRKPGEKASILVVPEDVLFPNIASTMGTGLSFSQFTPGNYKVFAFDSLEGIDYYDTQTLAEYASQAARVTVAANGNASVVVDVIHVGD